MAKILLALLGLALGTGFFGVAFGVAFALIGAFIGWSIDARAQSFREQAAAKRGSLGYPPPPTAQASDLQREIAALQRRVARLEQALVGLGAELPADQETPPAPPTPAAPAPSPAEMTASPAAASAAALEPGTQEAAAPQATAEQPGLFARLISGNLVAKVGAVVLFFGVGFLLKFAYDRGLMPPQLRVAGVGALALALFVVGWRLRDTRRLYGIVVQGVASGLAYLDVYFALKVYGFIDVLPAFALFTALGVATTVLAVRQDAPSLAVYGLTGAFLAPVLASTGAGNHVVLFSYYTVLNLFILAVSWFKAWRALNLTGWLFTFVIGLAWGAGNYRPELFGTIEPFVLAFFGIYLVVPILFAARQPPRLRGLVDGTLVFGTPAATAVMQAALARDLPYGLAWSAAAGALVYAVLAALLLWRERMRLLGEVYVALAVGLATLAVFFAFGAYTTFAIWTLEGAAIVWVGLRQRRALAWSFGLLVQAGGALYFLLEYDDYLRLHPVWNDAVIGCALITAAGLLTARLLGRHAADLPAAARGIAPLALAAAGLAWLLGGVDAIHHGIERLREPAAYALFVSASALASEWAGARLAWRALRNVSAIQPLLLLVAGGVQALGSAHPLADLGAVAWPVSFGALVWTLRRQERDANAALAGLRHSVGLYLLVALLAWELHWLAGEWSDGIAWQTAALGLPCALALLAVLALETAQRWPAAQNALLYARLLLPLAAVAALWTVTANLHAPGGMQPLPYLPLANPIDAVAALSLLALLRWSRQSAARVGLAPDAGAKLLALLGFVALNGIALRSIHFWADVPYRFGDLFDSVLVQATLSLLWAGAALTLMLLARRRMQRLLWVIGAVLLGAVVVKLFLVDLAGSGTVARIVSFVGVGALLLLIGYVAPVPPGTQEDDARPGTPQD
ncbi:MAG TPA: DUF2339 domain-containing protein [Burkholderiales bacterium]|nr:DUF2339 domain-containing protein [Burkholderiales bacterium]